MDAKTYKYAAEMLDELTTVVDKEKRDDILLPELGSLNRLFAHVIRVRDVYRDRLRTGRVVLPGNASVETARLQHTEAMESRVALDAAGGS